MDTSRAAWIEFWGSEDKARLAWEALRGHPTFARFEDPLEADIREEEDPRFTVMQ